MSEGKYDVVYIEPALARVVNNIAEGLGHFAMKCREREERERKAREEAIQRRLAELELQLKTQAEQQRQARLEAEEADRQAAGQKVREAEARQRAKMAALVGQMEFKEEQVKVAAIHSASIASKTEDTAALKEQCRDLHEQLKILNPEAAATHSHFMREMKGETVTPQRLGLIVDALKLSYGRELTIKVRTECCREELGRLLKDCDPVIHGPDFQKGLEALMARPSISEEDVATLREQFYNLAEEARRATEKKRAIQKMADIASRFLADRGYEVLDGEGRNIALDKTYYLAGPSQDYRIELRVDSRGGLSSKLVKVASGEAEAQVPPNEYQRLLDKESGQKWCQTHDQLLKCLNDNGLRMKTKFRREPGSGVLPVLVDPRKDGRGRQREASQPKLVSRERK